MAFADGKLLAQCSGILIKLNEEDQVATILTSADLICTKFPSIHDKSSTREFAPHAKVGLLSSVLVLIALLGVRFLVISSFLQPLFQVDVHLLDDSIADGHLLNYHKHYNIAVLEVAVKESFQLPNLSSEVKLAQEVFVLGRDASLNLIVSHGRVDYMGPGLFKNNHYMYITCGVAKCGTGGPVIDFDGTFVGMASPTQRMSFIPVSIILRCLQLWEDHQWIVQAAGYLELVVLPTNEMLAVVYWVLVAVKGSPHYWLPKLRARGEKISCKFKIDDGLIVQKVSEGLAAEKTGIRIGDIIETCNGKQIVTTVDVGVFHIRKESHRTKADSTYNVSSAERSSRPDELTTVVKPTATGSSLVCPGLQGSRTGSGRPSPLPQIRASITKFPVPSSPPETTDHRCGRRSSDRPHRVLRRFHRTLRRADMAPTTSRKGEGEGSGSKTRAASKRRDTPARALTPSVTTRSRAAQSDSARRKRSADRAADKEHLDEPKRARAADRSREEEEEDTGSRSTGAQASASDVAEPAASSSRASSAVSSPLRCPYVPQVVKSHNPDGTEIYDPYIDSAVVSAYFEENKKYRVKLGTFEAIVFVSDTNYSS
ncbi:hypothetical protein PR202_ga11255 [Eleusine coracana subsp. coracana]|uniref:PDZ domain-containing protein n=1 Tax=Eleusine coracana subsp. coracana TaxID=191504 RepID=A0AAV5C900_ELECO|nr:hypothetical protein PR202_ga11255 [Eleusine coracana subsp. coracana]